MDRGRGRADHRRMRTRDREHGAGRNGGGNVPPRAVRLGGRDPPELAGAAGGRAPPAGVPPGRSSEGTTLNGAILAFQKSEGLPQTGFPDDETLRRLGIDPTTKDRAPGSEAGLPARMDGRGRESLMVRAAIIVVDDQLVELARLGQELRKRYGQDYEILEASSSGEALETLKARQEAERPVALVLAVHWIEADLGHRGPRPGPGAPPDREAGSPRRLGQSRVQRSSPRSDVSRVGGLLRPQAQGRRTRSSTGPSVRSSLTGRGSRESGSSRSAASGTRRGTLTRAPGHPDSQRAAARFRRRSHAGGPLGAAQAWDVDRRPPGGHRPRPAADGESIERSNRRCVSATMSTPPWTSAST